jgi:hypothetical protein
MKLSKHRKRRARADARQSSHTLSEGIATDAPPIAAVVASLFTRLRLAQRARVLRSLLMPIGPMALAVLGGGAFAKFAAQARLPQMSISLDDAARVTWNQVFDLVRYVEQSNPHALHQVMTLLTRDTTTMAAVGASVTAIVVRQMARRGIAARSASAMRAAAPAA